MKIKNCFITNSSSTSFIVGKFKTDAKTKITVEVDLERFNHEKLKTIEEVDKYFMEECYYSPEDENYIKAKEVIKKGGEVLIITVSNEGVYDNDMELYLYKNGINNLTFNEGVVIINGDGNY